MATLPYHLPVNTDIAASIRRLRISPCGKFVATQRSDMKRVIFVWAIEPEKSKKGLIPASNKAPHSIIEQATDIKCAAWSPGGAAARLAVCTGNDKIYGNFCERRLCEVNFCVCDVGEFFVFSYGQRRAYSV